MHGSELPKQSSQPPAPQEVRRQLARILTSPDFNVPGRLRGFLTYVVEESLAGRGDRIKAYSIATAVFGRAQDFDVQNDPVVRIEAGRLRRALELYYLTGGLTDPIVIKIPKGGYAPSIRRRCDLEVPAASAEQAAAAQETSPSLRKSGAWRSALPKASVPALGAVLILVVALAWGLMAYRSDDAVESGDSEVVLIVSKLANLSGNEGALYAAAISDELLSQLARFRELRIVSRDSVSSAPAGNLALQRPAAVQYLLEGSVRTADKHLRVASRLIDGRTGKIVWSQIYDRDLRGTGSFEIESDIASKVATAVAQPYGAIFTPVSRDASTRVPGYAEAYLCVLQFYHYRKVLNSEEHARTRDCLERTTARSPDYSTGWAMLAYLYLDEDRFDLNRRPQASPGKVWARQAAERAISLDPSNVRGLQALMTVLFFSEQPEDALRIGEQALALNPNDNEVLAALGGLIAQAGDWKRGMAMMEQALARNPDQTRYYVGLVALSCYMLGDDKCALDWIRRADLKQFSVYHFVAALIFARAGLQAEARESVSAFLTMRPRFFDKFDGELAMRNFNERDRRVIIEGARQAGFPVGSASH